ncbi:phosphatidylglycerol lysyltransferase domain-containing protein [Ruminococcaceae bacterium OttesenSCG-928-L11]|nr:phosphatidylglycerol lysyltransferase domain-containing protein [Ruminococcaceae bacterium OttesenSCG-928-L11]
MSMQTAIVSEPTVDSLHFKEIALSDREWMEPLLRASDYRSEEYSFTFAYVWRGVFAYKAARYRDMLIIKSERETHPPSYLFPAGSGDIGAVIEALIHDARANGHGLLFHTILPEQIQVLETLYPGRFHITPIRDYWDYLYDAQSLITLAGKKLHAKRNHINRFKENNPDWTYEPITHDNLPEVLAMTDQWLEGHEVKSKTLMQESRAVCAAIRDFDALGLDGGAIRTGGRIVAFSMGDRLSSDTYHIQIEKAFGDVQGAYAIINQQFAAHNCADYRYINREDDSGQEGLRKAKESYRPVMMVEKHIAKLLDA